jgi:hypothetical protein
VINNVITLAGAHDPGARRGVLSRFRHGPLARHLPFQLAGNIRQGGLVERPSA